MKRPYLMCYGCNCWGSCDADCLENGETVTVYYLDKDGKVVEKLGELGKQELEMPKGGEQ